MNVKSKRPIYINSIVSILTNSVSFCTCEQVLGKSKDDLVENVKKAQQKLYPTKIARDGSIMEWVSETKKTSELIFYTGSASVYTQRLQWPMGPTWR